jgi:transcriptional regulator of acetoin/glycerol metabolism
VSQTEEGTFMGCRSKAAGPGNAVYAERFEGFGEDWHISLEARSDIQAARRQRVNVLIMAESAMTEAVLELLLDPAESTIPSGRMAPLDGPSPTRATTLVLHNVDQLTTRAQAAIVNWLDQSKGRIWIVSTATTPLWPRVQAGAFDEVLYYRLNAVCIQPETH